MPLNARRHIRRMRGGAQAHLLEADDGRCYVVKFLNNPQHRRILINELLAVSFLGYLQIAAPEAAIISISQDFFEQNPDVCLELGSRRVPVPPGWHFGSCFPGDPDRTAVYDFLPDTLLRQVSNLAHFLGVLVLDKWMGNADARQAIYFRTRIHDWDSTGGHAPRTGFLACMIDQGFVLGGPHWEFHDAPLQGLAPRPAVYEDVRSLEDFQPWLDRVTNFPEEVVDQARKQVPAQWLEGDEDALDQVLEKLLLRRQRVAALLEECRCARTSLFPNWH